MIKIVDDEFMRHHYSWHWTHIKLGTQSLRKHFSDGPLSSHVYKVRDWCPENGSEMRYYALISNFYFENPADATLFALR